jgi:serine/threonine protein kinase
MKHICSRCKLMSEDGNLWCQEVDCPAGTLPLLMRYGDYLGNLKILELKRVLLSATIYKVERGFGKEAEVFLMKMANPGSDNEEYVRREAEALRLLSEGRTHPSGLPRWQPHGATNGQDPFGIAALGEQTRFYYLMEYVEGEFLFDTLLDNPQPWHEHVGWYMMSLCETLYEVQRLTGCLHLNINPDVLLVRRNNAGVFQPVLVDMGLQLPPETPVTHDNLARFQQHLLPAYTPPELVSGGTISARADVFCLGLVMYEMLAGKPAYPYARRRTEDIYRALRQLPPRLHRVDLPVLARFARRPRQQPVPMLEVLQSAIGGKYSDVSELRGALFDLYGTIEDRYKFDFGIFFRRAGLTIAIITVIAFLVYILFIFVTALGQ